MKVQTWKLNILINSNTHHVLNYRIRSAHQQPQWLVARVRFFYYSEARALISPTKLSLAYFFYYKDTLTTRLLVCCFLLCLVSFRSLSKSTNVTPIFVCYFFRVFFSSFALLLWWFFFINSLLHKYDNNTLYVSLLFSLLLWSLKCII